MARVGIRELKAKLSEYIDRVRRGEPVVITLHGEEVAELRPLGELPEVRALRELIEEKGGFFSPTKPELRPALKVRVKGKPMSETLLQDREDRV